MSIFVGHGYITNRLLVSRQACAKILIIRTLSKRLVHIYIFGVHCLSFLIKMANNYVVTAHKPTAVNACVTGNQICHNGVLSLSDKMHFVKMSWVKRWVGAVIFLIQVL